AHLVDEGCEQKRILLELARSFEQPCRVPSRLVLVQTGAQSSQSTSKAYAVDPGDWGARFGWPVLRLDARIRPSIHLHLGPSAFPPRRTVGESQGHHHAEQHARTHPHSVFGALQRALLEPKKAGRPPAK